MSTEKSVRSVLSSLRSHLPLLATCCLLTFVATAGAAEQPRFHADLTQGRALWDQACQADANCAAECVDLYYRCAVVAYACLAANPQDEAAALPLYNSSISRCLRAATRHQRIDARSHLTIQAPAGTMTVPIKHTGFVWKPGEFSYLIDPSDIKRSDDFLRVHARDGVGAIEVVVRDPQCNETDRFMLPKWHSFAATALLRPDLDAWKQGKLPKDTLEFVDPVRIEKVDLAGRQYCLAADFDAPVSQIRLLGDELGYRKGNFLMPAKFANLAGIYFLEPYQPGKIPLVLIHGTQSGMTTWGDLFNDLRMNSWFVQNYQVWLFTYPTGEPYLQTAHTLRTALQEVRGTFDPKCTDPALGEMVLAGHSQGGMLVKPMVTWSDDRITRAVFRVPFDRLNLTADERERLSNFLIFEPQDCVKRAIYICTPFTGVTVPASIASRFARFVIQEPDESKDRWRQVRQDNRLKIRIAFRHLPTSTELFVRHQPLHETLTELRVNPCVVSHCIIGKGEKLPAISLSDRVVPVRSAQTKEAASTIYVNHNHGIVHRAPETTVEVQRILCEHLTCLGRN